MKKLKVFKIAATSVAAVALIGVGGAALVACGDDAPAANNSTVKTYSMRIASWDEWSAHN